MTNKMMILNAVIGVFIGNIFYAFVKQMYQVSTDLLGITIIYFTFLSLATYFQTRHWNREARVEVQKVIDEVRAAVWKAKDND